MFNQPKEIKDEILYGDVLCVSAYKPLAYMEYGEFEGKQIFPRCLAYVPLRILETLLKKDNVYVVTHGTELYGDKIIECKNPPKNTRLILTEKDESSGTHVFHMPGLLDLLNRNSDIVIRELLFDSLSRGTPTISIKPPITEKIVIEFVKLVSRSKQWDAQAQALIDACFADPAFLKSPAKDKIVLTQELEKTFSTIKDVSYENRYKEIQQLDKKSKLSPN